MTRTVTIDPVTRIEGHAKITKLVSENHRRAYDMEQLIRLFVDIDCNTVAAQYDRQSQSADAPANHCDAAFFFIISLHVSNYLVVLAANLK